jgi:hypothetical protein
MNTGNHPREDRKQLSSTLLMPNQDLTRLTNTCSYGAHYRNRANKIPVSCPSAFIDAHLYPDLVWPVSTRYQSWPTIASRDRQGIVHHRSCCLVQHAPEVGSGSTCRRVLGPELDP